MSINDAKQSDFIAVQLEYFVNDADNIENNDSILNNEVCEYKDLITRLKELKSTIALLEKTIFK